MLYAVPHRNLVKPNASGDTMSKAGDVIENPVTGERAVIRIGTEESGGEFLLVDLFVSPGGAVIGEHVHPARPVRGRGPGAPRHHIDGNGVRYLRPHHMQFPAGCDREPIGRGL